MWILIRCALQHPRPVVSFTRRMKFDKLKFVVLLYWRGSALAFPSGEGGTANAVTEEVYRQYVAVFVGCGLFRRLASCKIPDFMI